MPIVLPQALDRALSMFGAIRSKIDEVLLVDGVRRVQSLWIGYVPKYNPYLRRLSIAGIDSGYNYAEYRGYALYVANVVWVIIGGDKGEIADGFADIDVSSSTMLEHELSILSITMEIEAVKRVLDRADLVLVDGSLVAKFYRLLRARDEGLDILGSKKVSLREAMNELLYAVALYPGKVVFLSKNSNAKDVLGLVKGDVYYFERYTDGVPGYSRPLLLEESSQRGSATLARVLKHSIKDVVGLDATPVATYIRLEPFARVYRLEFVAERDDDPETRVRYVMDALSLYTIAGYPYPLMRADQLAKVSDTDLERIRAVLGIVSDPYSREPLAV